MTDTWQATANATESIEWGTNIVGGVTPGKNGEHLGLPVLPTVREVPNPLTHRVQGDTYHKIKAMEKLKPGATGIYVAAHQAPGAIEEAIEAEIPLIVAVAEHIPIHDIMRVCRELFLGKLANVCRYIRCSKLSQDPD